MRETPIQSKDIVALTFIVVIGYLLAHGYDHMMVAIFTSIAIYYFGIDRWLEKLIRLQREGTRKRRR